MHIYQHRSRLKEGDTDFTSHIGTYRFFPNGPIQLPKMIQHFILPFMLLSAQLIAADCTHNNCLRAVIGELSLYRHLLPHFIPN